MTDCAESILVQAAEPVIEAWRIVWIFATLVALISACATPLHAQERDKQGVLHVVPEHDKHATTHKAFRDKAGIP